MSHPKPMTKSAADIHANIERDAERVRQLVRGLPGYRPCRQDAPNILKLVRAAVRYVNKRSPNSKAKSFIYHGKMYRLRFTTLGQILVCNSTGVILGCSGYDSI